MLSILIPVYNFNVVELVKELDSQAAEAFIDYEIRVYEDGSQQFTKENSTLSDLEFCHYKMLPKNIGRSAIRNLLAAEARYEYLIFLDCDAEICHDYFINKYLSFCHDNIVVTGGRVYPKDTPPSKNLLVKYGSKRERHNPKDINKKYKNFTTPNFLIPRSIFNEIQFDENIAGYGHEDTLFGLELQRKGHDFILVDNPVIHIGLEDNDVFLDKSKHALRNLLSIYRSGDYPEIITVSKIISVFEVLQKLKLTGLGSFLYRTTSRLMKRNLLGKNPSLMVFDLYKLAYICHYSRGK